MSNIPPLYLLLLLTLVACRGGGKSFDEQHLQFDNLHASFKPTVKEQYFGTRGELNRILHLKKRGRAVTAVVVLGGGPLSSASDKSYIGAISRLYGSVQADLFLMDYSGSICCNGALQSRLKAEGLPALEVDADIVHSYVGSIRRKGYDAVYIHAASFSGLIALQLNSSEKVAGVEGILMFAPLIKYFPSDYVYNREAGIFPSKFSIDERKEAYKGINESLLKIYEDRLETSPGYIWIERVRERYSVKTNTMVFLPEHDNRYDVEFVGNFFCDKGAHVEVVKGAFHESVLVDYSVRSDVEAFIKVGNPSDICGG